MAPPMVVVVVMMVMVIIVVMVMVMVVIVLSQNQRRLRRPLVWRELRLSLQDIGRIGNRVEQFCEGARRADAVRSLDRE